ncbi:MAG: energy-coupling factor transporter ATPase [Clostridiales bacterium]|nr:energy-coupling factor transporter ATPase [Clostridiales bacterium]
MSIIIENLSHIYMEGGPFEFEALDGINLRIEDGEFVGLIGHTGSGKSTLIQHLNGLLKPTSGSVEVDGIKIEAKSKNLRELRRRVGLVFQYPEHQLFEETIYKDIAFGPKNLGYSEKEIEKRVIEAMGLVGLDYEELKSRSPFGLSGGQRRRVAIAGVLAMKPKTLILDEPTAGLDPKGRDEILGQVADLHKKNNLTTILVSHSMEDIARLVDRIIVLNKGKIALDGTPSQVFAHSREIEAMGLAIPGISSLMGDLREAGMDVPEDIFTVEAATDAILKALRGNLDA